MKHICIKITAYVLVLVLTSGSIFTAFSFTADAKGVRDLYGTGSADDIDITRLLDMALNKGGMSMSPSTIKAFLEYWWDSVAADLNICIGNADSAITNTQTFADYVISALADCEHYDKLGEIIKRYVQYVLTLDYKSLSDFKQLLTQEGTFRNFLLSYVVDDTGNIANTVNNKLKKYSLKSGLVNMVRKAADAYIEEYEGYFMIPTYTYKDVSVSWFPSRELHDFVYSSLKTISAGGIYGMSLVRYNGSYCLLNLSSSNFVIYSNRSEDRNYSYFPSYLMSSNWDAERPYYTVFYQNNALSATCDFYDLSDVSFMFDGVKYTNVMDLYTSPYFVDYLNTNLNDIVLFTSDGRSVKWWKSLDAFKQYTVGKSNIYYSNIYSSFDNSVDNSVTFTGQYYTNNAYSHTTIQNNIDNSQEINETTINNIVNNYITNNYYGTDNSGGDGSGGNSGDDSVISKFLTALVDGLAALVESFDKLLEGIENLFTKLFIPSEGFADPIKEKINTKFYFVEETHSDILGLVDRFDTMGKTPPTITFPFSKTILAKYGVSDITVSFEWFEPYRVGFQLLISAIMWAMFLFSQFFGLKNLIQGTDSAVRNITP